LAISATVGWDVAFDCLFPLMLAFLLNMALNAQGLGVSPALFLGALVMLGFWLSSLATQFARDALVAQFTAQFLATVRSLLEKQNLERSTQVNELFSRHLVCLLYTSPSPRDH
jgi:hypothetical protein